MSSVSLATRAPVTVNHSAPSNHLSPETMRILKSCFWERMNETSTAKSTLKDLSREFALIRLICSSDDAKEISDFLLLLGKKDWSAPTGLRLASAGGYLEVVRKILGSLDLEKGFGGPDFTNAIEAAAEYNHLEVVNYLAPNLRPEESHFSALLGAIRGGQKELFYTLIAKNVNVRNYRPLLQAAGQLGDLEIIQSLLEKAAATPGNSVHLFSDDCLEASVKNDHIHVIEFLVISGKITNRGFTAAILYAAARGHDHLIVLFLLLNITLENPYPLEETLATASAEHPATLTVLMKFTEFQSVIEKGVRVNNRSRLENGRLITYQDYVAKKNLSC